MSEWADETLVAVHWDSKRRIYKILELPARSSNLITSKQSFTTYDQAEQSIDYQYPKALAVQVEDIKAERRERYDWEQTHSFVLVFKMFREKEERTNMGMIEESEALERYEQTKISLSLSQGGYILLFEGVRSKYPIKAERVGHERTSQCTVH